MTQPSVLIINRVFPPQRGATGRMAQDLANALAHSGWRVTVLSVADKKMPPHKHDNFNHITIKAAANPKGAWGYAMTLLKLLIAGKRAPKVDVVITMTDPPLLAMIGNRIAKSKRASHVHWCQDLYPDLFQALGMKFPKFLTQILRVKSRKALNKAQKIVVVGRCMAERLKQTGVHPNKIEMIANWADFEVIAPTKDVHHNMLPIDMTGVAKKPEEMFRDNSPKFRVLYAGNIGRAHPMRSVIEAAALLADKTEIEFVFVGDQDVHSILSRERGSRHLENIKFMPYQPIEKLRDVMESGDLHLVTMRPEARGLLVPCKFYSGLTVGRPTLFVGPEKSEIGHVIRGYGAGVIIPPKDPQALADAIYAYRTDGDAWFQAQEGALRAAKAYHPNQSLHKWIELLDKYRVS